MKNKWFAFTKPHQENMPNILLFPHAGAGASAFASWGKVFTQEGFGFYPVQYAGRESRMSEPADTDIHKLAEDLVLSEPELFQGDFIFYGKCLGALTAFAVSEAMEKYYHHKPKLLITSSGASPEDMKLERPLNQNIQSLLLKYHFVTEEQLKDETFQEYYLPVIQNDYLLQMSFQENYYKIPCDIMAFYGKEDSRLNAEMLRKWKNYTDGNYTEYAFSGNHFFENQGHLQEIVSIIKKEVMNYEFE